MSSRPNRNDLFGLALGIFATLSQVVLIREALCVSGGNELTVGLGFTLWLLAVGAGALLAGTLPHPGAALLFGSAFAPLLTASGLLVLRLHREIVSVPLGAGPSLFGYLILFAAGLGLGGFAVGFLFTSAARASKEDKGAPVSRLYTLESLGALLGGLLFAFLLAGRVPHLVTIGLAGSLPLATVAISCGPDRPRTRLFSVASALLLAAASACGLVAAIDSWAEARAFSLIGGAGKLVASADSAYGRLTIGQSEGQFQLLTDGRFDYAFPDPWERPVPVHLALVQHPSPKHLLILGGGPADRLEAALSHKLEQVVLTYLDDRAHTLSRSFWPASTKAALADPRVTVVHDDSRRYVSRTRDRFDVVLISAGPPLSGRANRYHTVEFFRAVSQVLNPGGSMTVFAPGGANLLAPEAARATASELATVRSVFNEVVIVPGLQTTINAAFEKGVISGSSKVLEERFAARGIDAPYFSSRRFLNMLDPERNASIRGQLSRWPATINSDVKPLAYLAGLQLWERSLSKVRGAGDPTWTGLAEKWAWLPLVAMLLLWLVWQGSIVVRRRNNISCAAFAIATTGAAGMAAEIVVLYVFQTASGQLYTGIAVLVALFMAGLALGAFFGRQHLSKGRLLHGVLADIFVLAFLLLTGPILSNSLELPWVVGGWSLVAGVVTGAAFPALLGLAAKNHSGDERRAAALIEAADHIGAAFGALITGAIWLPVYGITVTCLLFASLKAASLSGQLLSSRKIQSP